MKPIRTLAILALAGIVVAGCGRKIGLDTPYQAALDERREAQREGRPLPPEPTPPVEDRPFFLDALIK